MSCSWLGASLGRDRHDQTLGSFQNETLIGSSAVARLAVSGQGDVERVRGFASPQYRLRVGDWRVRYRYEDIDEDEEGISVTRVLHRREAYRKSALARQDIPDTDSFDETADREGPD